MSTFHKCERRILGIEESGLGEIAEVLPSAPILLGNRFPFHPNYEKWNCDSQYVLERNTTCFMASNKTRNMFAYRHHLQLSHTLKNPIARAITPTTKCLVRNLLCLYFSCIVARLMVSLLTSLHFRVTRRTSMIRATVSLTRPPYSALGFITRGRYLTGAHHQ